MTTRDGTQERTLDPPDDSLSDAEMRACERAAREGFDAMDCRSMRWIDDMLADTPEDFVTLVRTVFLCRKHPLAANNKDSPLAMSMGSALLRVRDRYVAECAEDYAAELAEQAKFAQEP